MATSTHWRSGAGMDTMSGRASSYDINRSGKGLDPVASWGATDDSAFENDGRAHPGIGTAYERLKAFFGEPRYDRRRLMDEPEKENSDYPEAFSQLWGGGEDGKMARNGHLEQVLLEKTVGSDNWFLQVLAPWMYSTTMKFTWNMQIFGRTTLDRLPEEAVPRLLNQRRTGGSASLMRYGIALLLEATFAETPIGQRTYLMNIEQMKVATTDTASYGVMVALMEHTPYDDPATRQSSSSAKIDIHAVDRRLRDEIDNWALITKEGPAKVASNLRNRLSNRGIRGNVTIWPQGVSSQMSMGRDSHGCENRESIAFSTGSETAYMHDPLVRHRTIGSFITLDDAAVRTMDVMDYKTSMMDTVAYDEIGDKFFMARYATGYRYTGVWNYSSPSAPLTSGIGGSMMKDLAVYTYGQLYRKAASGGFARAAEKIYRLGISKPELRAEFLASLSLHKKDDLRLASGGKSYPPMQGTGSFSAKLFDEARIFGPNDWATELISVDDHRRAKDAEGSLSLRAMDERAEYKARMLTTKRKIGLDEEETELPMSAKVAWERGMDDEYMTDAAPDRFSYMGDGTVLKVPGSVGVTRVVRRKLGGGVAQSMAGFESVGLDKYAEAVNESVNAIVIDGPMGGSTQGTATVVSEWTKKLVSVIVDGQDETEAQKATLLSELRRIVQGVIYTAQYGARDKTIKKAREDKDTNTKAKPETEAAEIKAFEVKVAAANKAAPIIDIEALQNTIIAGFAPFAARIQTRVAVDSVQEERTAIEDLVSAPGSSLFQSVPSTIVGESCLWSPDGSEDLGQVRLDVFNSDDNIIPIPHDAFAATLAARHNVLFRLTYDEAGKLLTEFKPKLETKGARRDRVDSLYWSIAISALARGIQQINLGGKAWNAASAADRPSGTIADLMTHFKKVVAAQPALETRLKRAAKNAVKRPVLLSQSHLDGQIKALTNLLAKQWDSEIAVVDAKLASWKGAAALLTTGYVAPDQLDVEAIVAKSSSAPRAKAANRTVTTAANSEAPQAWSQGFVENCLNRASVHDGRYMTFAVDKNIPVPLAARMWRPNKCYEMASVIHMKAGAEGAARTYYQNPHMMMAGNAAQKMIYGHFTMYFRTIVLHNDMITIERDVYCKNSLGGNGKASWDPTNPKHTDAFNDHRMGTASCFWTFVRQNNVENTHWWLSITGQLPSWMAVDNAVAASLRWDGCNGFAQHWGYRNGTTDISLHMPFSGRNNINDRKYNVICVQDFQMKYNPADQGRYSDVVQNQGHWGQAACYPGAARVMRGKADHFAIPDYMPIKRQEIITL